MWVESSPGRDALANRGLAPEALAFCFLIRNKHAAGSDVISTSSYEESRG